MASTLPYESVRTPVLTWGALCVAIEKGLVPAPIRNGSHEISVGALRHLQPSAKLGALPACTSPRDLPARHLRLLPPRHPEAEQPTL